MKGIGIRLLIVAVIAGGGFILRDRLSGAAGDLAVGDCFDIPTTAAQEVEDVQHHPCTEGHTAEVILVRDYTGSDAFPSDAQFDAFVEANCIPAFDAYTGLDYDTEPALGLGFFTPTADGWTSGDHEVICYLGRIDGTAMSVSLKTAE